MAKETQKRTKEVAYCMVCILVLLTRSLVSDCLRRHKLYPARLLCTCAINCTLPGSSVHGILSARILEWGATSSSRGSSRDQTRISYVSLHWQADTTSTTWEYAVPIHNICQYTKYTKSSYNSTSRNKPPNL